jgi:hypothetical protein
MMEEQTKVKRIIENVWGYGRVITSEECEYLKGLVPDGENKPSLQCALEYMRVYTMWDSAGRPAFGAFRVWWNQLKTIL